MAGSIAGAFFSGDKPKVPEYPLVNLTEEQLLAIKGNIAALPSLAQLTDRVNTISADQLLKQLERVFPGYGSILAKGTETLQSQMRGEIPEDVSRQIGRLSAERARGGGYANSEFADNLEARDLGLTSLGIINQSLNTAERWMAQANARTPRFDFTSMFVSPQQRIQVRMYENQQKFQRDLMKARVDALPEPWETALKNFFDNVEESGQAALGAYAGGLMGGQMGGGAGASSGGGSGAVDYGAPLQYFQSAPPPQLNDYSGTYYEPPVQSYDLGPQYFDQPSGPVGQHQWGGP